MLSPSVNVIKHFFFVTDDEAIKLEHFASATLSSLVLYLRIRLEPTRPLSGKLHALPTNIRPGWNGLTGPNGPAYLALVTKK